MLLDHSKYAVKATTVAFSSKTSFEILDEKGEQLATAEDKTGFLAGLFGGAVYEVRDSGSGEVVFSLCRSGFLMKKDEVKDPKGEVVGRYKSKMFSLSGGFHVYDKDGKHLAEIQGKMLKKEYKFLTPEKAEIGVVSRTWEGFAKEMLTGDGSYGVTIQPRFAEDKRAKILVLAATIAAETIFKPKKSDSSGSSSDDD